MKPWAILRLVLPAAVLCFAARLAGGAAPAASAAPQVASRTTAFLHASVVPVRVEVLGP